MKRSPAEFASLVRLLDDESEPVRSAVAKRLLDYEDELPDFISQLDPLPATDIFALMNRLIREAKCETLVDHWEDALTETEPLRRLEEALGLLSDYLDRSRLRSGRLQQELDDLANEIRPLATTALALVDILFTQGRFTGNRIDYYAPENSSLLSVVQGGEGNPISLSCLLILLGRRLGYQIGGCNYPGHFLALIPRGESPVLVDCFNGGQLVTAEDLIDSTVNESTDLRETLLREASPEAILLRVLRNLERAFHQSNDEAERAVFEDLIERMLISGTV